MAQFDRLAAAWSSGRSEAAPRGPQTVHRPRPPSPSARPQGGKEESSTPKRHRLIDAQLTHFILAAKLFFVAFFFTNFQIYLSILNV